MRKMRKNTSRSDKYLLVNYKEINRAELEYDVKVKLCDLSFCSDCELELCDNVIKNNTSLANDERPIFRMVIIFVIAVAAAILTFFLFSAGLWGILGYVTAVCSIFCLGGSVFCLQDYLKKKTDGA